MSIDELLKTDTSGMSLSEMISKIGDSILANPNALYLLRKRHESDSGIPMEEDDFGIKEHDMIHGAFKEIEKSLTDAL